MKTRFTSVREFRERRVPRCWPAAHRVNGRAERVVRSKSAGQKRVKSSRRTEGHKEAAHEIDPEREDREKESNACVDARTAHAHDSREGKVRQTTTLTPYIYMNMYMHM